MLSTFYTGTSGLVLPITQSLFPPEFQGKSRLTYYASLFNSIEINSSFYKLPKAATVKNWSDNVGSNFRFTFKLLKDITHAKQLHYSTAHVKLFMQTISEVGDKKGCLLIQFPPKLHFENFHRLEDLLNNLQECNREYHWKIAIEFRNPSWYVGETIELLNHHKAAMVIHDIPASATPFINLKSDFKYLRFHGPGGKYRGTYTDEFLKSYASFIKDWLKEKKQMFVYFNNTMGDALNNLNTLNKLVQS